MNQRCPICILPGHLDYRSSLYRFLRVHCIVNKKGTQLGTQRTLVFLEIVNFFDVFQINMFNHYYSTVYYRQSTTYGLRYYVCVNLENIIFVEYPVILFLSPLRVVVVLVLRRRPPILSQQLLLQACKVRMVPDRCRRTLPLQGLSLIMATGIEFGLFSLPLVYVLDHVRSVYWCTGQCCALRTYGVETVVPIACTGFYVCSVLSK